MHAKPRTRLRNLLSCGFFLCSNVGHDVFQLENIPNGKKDYKGHTTGLDPRQRYKNFKHMFTLRLNTPYNFQIHSVTYFVPVTYSICIKDLERAFCQNILSNCWCVSFLYFHKGIELQMSHFLSKNEP